MILSLQDGDTIHGSSSNAHASVINTWDDVLTTVSHGA